MATEVIKKEYFEDQTLMWFFDTIKSHYHEYSTIPSSHVIQNELKKASAAKKIKSADITDYVEVFSKLSQKVASHRYYAEEVVKFCRRQSGIKIFMEAAGTMDDADDDDWDKILENLYNVRNIGVTELSMGMNYFDDAEDRAKRRQQEDHRIVAPTGIRGWHPRSGVHIDVDTKLGGGLKSGQVGVWMGATNLGKSIALVHCGKRAVVGGLKVVHYTMELSAEDIADRYDASWTGAEINSLASRGPEISNRLNEICAKRGYKDRLIIQKYPTGLATVNTIRVHLRQLEAMGWTPDVLIVDYIDLLKPLTNYNDEYADLGAITKDLRGLADELEVPMWTATQVNRSGFNQEVVDVEHIGDSLKKAQIADVIIAMCASREERDNETMRLHLAKNRNGPAKIEIEIKQKYAKMWFWDPSGHPPETPENAPPEV